MSGAVADGLACGAMLPIATHVDGAEHDTALSPELIPSVEGMAIMLQTLSLRDSAKVDSSAFPSFVLRVV
jgi:hypothetical protein